MLIEPAILRALKNDEFYGKITTSQLREIARQLEVKESDLKCTHKTKRVLRKRIINFLESNV